MSDELKERKLSIETITKLSYTMSQEEIKEALIAWLTKNFQQFRGATFDFEDLIDDEITITAEKTK